MSSDEPNPVAEYAEREKIGPTELASRLGISKGSAHELISGKRRIGPKTAQRLARITGKPWRDLMPEPNDTGTAA